MGHANEHSVFSRALFRAAAAATSPAAGTGSRGASGGDDDEGASTGTRDRGRLLPPPPPPPPGEDAAVCTTTADERRRSDDWRTDRACVSTCSGGACGGCESRHTPTREELVSIQGYPASRLIGWGPVQEVQHAGFEQRSVLPHPSSTCRSCREVRRAACGVGRCRISPFGNAEFRGSFSLSFSSPGAGFSPFWVGASV
jgi:hypothetical protein